MKHENTGDTPEIRQRQYRGVLVGLLAAVLLASGITLWIDSSEQEPDSSVAEESRTEVTEAEASDPEDSQTGSVNQDTVEANPEIEPDEPEIAEAEGPSAEPEEEPAEPADAGTIAWEAFDPSHMTLLWPVSGVVVRNYSVATLIYDATLDQYATNDSISISAEETEEVLAAADGIVKEVGCSDRLGYYVVLDNGNGYETTYGQLSEDVPVTVGETVLSGQTLGRISSPSWYSVALGTHLTFAVSFQGTAVNPIDYLENVLED